MFVEDGYFNIYSISEEVALLFRVGRPELLLGVFVLLLGIFTLLSYPFGLFWWHAQTLEAAQMAGSPTQGQLLIAKRGMGDPRFRKSVILLLEHDIEGSIGLVINRPSQQRLSIVLSDVGELDIRSDTILLGGPVRLGEMRVLFQAMTEPDEAWQVFREVYVSGSAAVLRRLVRDGNEVPAFRAYAGYSGWGSGQLEHEILRGDWHILPADIHTVFEVEYDEMWRMLIARVGQRAMKLPMHENRVEVNSSYILFGSLRR